MTQFDVHRTLGDAARVAPFVVVLQSDLVTPLGTVVVAPARPVAGFGPTIKHLHVTADLEGAAYVITVEELVSLPRSTVGPRVGSLSNLRRELIAAIDFLFVGY